MIRPSICCPIQLVGSDKWYHIAKCASILVRDLSITSLLFALGSPFLAKVASPMPGDNSFLVLLPKFEPVPISLLFPCQYVGMSSARRYSFVPIRRPIKSFSAVFVFFIGSVSLTCHSIAAAGVARLCLRSNRLRQVIVLGDLGAVKLPADVTSQLLSVAAMSPPSILRHIFYRRNIQPRDQQCCCTARASIRSLLMIDLIRSWYIRSIDDYLLGSEAPFIRVMSPIRFISL